MLQGVVRGILEIEAAVLMQMANFIPSLAGLIPSPAGGQGVVLFPERAPYQVAFRTRALNTEVSRQQHLNVKSYYSTIVLLPVGTSNAFCFFLGVKVAFLNFHLKPPPHP